MESSTRGNGPPFRYLSRPRSRGLLLAGTLIAAGAASGCDAPALGTGATLNVSFESSVLYPITGPLPAVTSKLQCLSARGAVIDLRAWNSDGTPASSVAVSLWLDPASGAFLVPFSAMKGFIASSEASVTLNSDGEGSLCLMPGTTPGTVTVVAHSGTIEAMKTITVQGHVVPLGSTLTLDVSPVDLSDTLAETPSVCGLPAPTPCRPGRARRADVSILASSPDGMQPVPDGAVVLLDVTTGWLSTTEDCAMMAGPQPPSVMLMRGAAGTIWCFDDAARSGQLRATSGAVTATATTTVAAIPSSITLMSSAQSPASGATVTFTATVTACDDSPLGGVPVVFSSSGSGTVQFASNLPVETTTDGFATITAVVTPPATVSAALARNPNVDCAVTLEVAQ